MSLADLVPQQPKAPTARPPVSAQITREACPHHGHGFVRYSYPGAGSVIVGNCPAGKDNCLCRLEAKGELQQSEKES